MTKRDARPSKIAIILILLTLCLVPAAVSAQLSATFVGLGNGEDIYSRYYSRNVPARVFRMNVSGTEYQGFCIDLYTTISVGNTLLVNGPLDQDIRDDVDWCAVNYILNNYQPVNNSEAASIQAALWYLVTEPYGGYTGSGKYQFMSDPTSPTPYDAYRTSNPRDLVRNRAFAMINASRRDGLGCNFKYPVRVELTPVIANISPTGNQVITAKVFDQDGNGLPGITVNFVNNGPGTGSLSLPTNTTVADGTTAVTFTAGGGTDHAHIDAWVGGNYGTLLYDPGRNKQSVTTITLLPYSITNRSSIFWTANPSIRVDKLISTDNQTFTHANESPGIPVFVGDNVWYKLVVTNDGNVTLNSINLADSRYSACPPPSQLLPGEIFECRLGPYAVTSEGISCNSATADGTYLSTLVQDSDDACYNASATFTKSGTVFIDSNGNGTPDPGEAVENVLIWVCTRCDETFPASTVAIARTNSAGYYEVLHLPPGDYNVTVPRFTDDTADVNEWLFSSYTPFTNATIRYITSPIEGVVRSFSVGPNSTGNNFPFINGSISGFKRNSTNLQGLNGWNITLVNVTTASQVVFNITYTDPVNGTGFYNFTNVPFGIYWLNETNQTGFRAEPPSSWSKLIEINSTTPELFNQNFTNKPLGLIEGYKRNGSAVGNPGLAGWNISLYYRPNGTYVASTTTDATGYYNFTNVEWGNYRINETLQPGYINDTSLPVTVPPINATNLVRSNINITNQLPALIEGYKKNETGAGLSGWTIQLFNRPGGALLATAVTDANGYYNFTSVTNGGYYVNETVQPCYMNITATSVNVTINAANPKRIVNFTNQLRSRCISGYKLDDCSKAGLPGWTITLTNGTYTAANKTDANGYYQFCGLVPGDYNVTETVEDGWVPVSPTELLVTLPCDRNVTEQNFTNQRLLCISGYKLDDCSKVGLPGWTITLTNGTYNAANKTDANGYYQFCGLVPGDYNVTETMEDGWVPVTPTQRSVTLPCGSNITGQDFTNMPYGNISGIKFNDLDGNGIKNINDEPLPNWTINLYYAGNGTFITSAVTNGTGEYEFKDLPCGIYRVNETPKPDWTQTAPAGGNYIVEINGTSHNVTGRDFGNQQQIIRCACPTRAYYTYAQVGALANHTLQFTDKSTGYPVEWNWSFGDGTYSNLKNPLHQYASPGYYKITEYVKVCGCTGQVYWTSYTRTSVRVR